MATVTKWTPFGVALNVTATTGTVTRTSATEYTVVIKASWESYYSGAKTNYGMKASSGGASKVINTFGNKATSGSGSFTGTYSISENGKQTKSITVKFENYNTDNGDSATKSVTLSVSVPAWTSYTVSYNDNGGSGAPASQTKWKNQDLTLSTTKPTRTGYSFQGWGTSASDTSVDYSAGGTVAASTNNDLTLYAIWKANNYTVSYNANGGSGAPSSQTKTHGTNLTLSNTKPTRTNYTFLGWATSAKATSASYTAGGTYSTNAAVTLYAVWKLAYKKPTISDFNVYRCDSTGTFSETGTYYKVEFNWSCDQTIGTNNLKQIVLVRNDGGNTDITADTDASATSGTMSRISGGGKASIEESHIIKITVYDTAGTSGNNYTTVTALLPAAIFPIDAKRGGKGLGFGMPADTDDVAKFGFKPIFYRGARALNSETNPQSRLYEAISSVIDENTAYHAERTDKNVSVWFGIGSGGMNHGVYSEYIGDWILFNNGTQTVLRSKSNYSVCLDSNNLFMPPGYGYYTTYGGDAGGPLAILNSNGLSAYLGPPDLDKETTTFIRGQNVRIYNHSGGGVYLGSSGSTAVTSDRNLKKDIVELSEKYVDFFERLVAVTYKYDSEENKGHRDHIGYIAQDVEKALTESGLTTEQFAGICIENDVTIDANYSPSVKIDDETSTEDLSTPCHYDTLYSLRYEEFIALNTHMIQRANKIIKSQQKEIEKLKEKVSQQDARLAKIEELLGV